MRWALVLPNRSLIGIASVLFTVALVAPAFAAEKPDASARAKPSGASVSSVGRMNPVAAVAGLPPWTPPATYSVDMVMKAEGETFTMKRFIAGDRIRSEIQAGDQSIVMIELGDEAGTSYTLMPDEKRAMKMSRAKLAAMAPDVAPKAPPEGEAKTQDAKVEPLGDEVLDGIAAKKYRIASEGGTVLAWFDAATSAPLRMESKNDGKTALMEWRNLKAGPQPEKLYEIPKGFEVMDMDEMMEQAKSMKGGPGMAGLSGLMSGVPGAGGMGGGLGGMAQGMGQRFGADMGSSLGQTFGTAFGGPLGGIAGNYLGGKIGGWLGAKTVKAVTPGD